MRPLLLVLAALVLFTPAALAHADRDVWLGTSCVTVLTYDANDGSAVIANHMQSGVPCGGSVLDRTAFPAGSCAPTPYEELHCASADPFTPSWNQTLDVSYGYGFHMVDGPDEAWGWLQQVV